MKKLNHRGSAPLLILTLLLGVLLLLSAFGVSGDWKPKTTPYRLVNEPFIGWSLLATLAAGLALIRKGSELMQCVSALLFAGMVFGMAAASALFWDAWLAPMLVYATLPLLRSAVMTLRTLVPSDRPPKPA